MSSTASADALDASFDLLCVRRDAGRNGSADKAPLHIEGERFRNFSFISPVSMVGAQGFEP
jgi:hypothetical protein